MRRAITLLLSTAFIITMTGSAGLAAEQQKRGGQRPKERPSGGTASLYDIPPRWLIDAPTAGTLPRGYWDVVVRLSPHGGALSYIDIGLSNRFQLGLSYGGTEVISTESPDWNPDIGINLKFRFIDELEYFPAVTLGFSSQGTGPYSEEFKRYTYKSRGFYGVVSRSFYFYQWTAGGHFGLNYSLEDDVDEESEANFFIGFDATFNYNLQFTAEWDAALNDNRSHLPDDSTDYLFAGKGRGYMGMAIKWLFTENLELELIIKDLLLNRREADTFAREVRITYIDSF